MFVKATDIIFLVYNIDAQAMFIGADEAVNMVSIFPFRALKISVCEGHFYRPFFAGFIFSRAYASFRIFDADV